jgi:hypothetical protein
MIKHVGRHGDRKVAIVFREVPNEAHMALVVYTETMAVGMHDRLMQVIETPEAQSAESLADVMNRQLFSDGRNMLQTCHGEGMLKKVQTKEITVIANSKSSVILSELNSIITEMKAGEDAVTRLQQLDNQSGMTGTVGQQDDFGREIGAPALPVNSAEIAGSDAAKAQALDDASISHDLLAQSKRMEAEAKALIAESKRLAKDAAAMKPKVVKTRAKTTRTKKAKTTDGAT